MESNIVPDDFICHICHAIMVDPQILHCGHGLCEACCLQIHTRGDAKCPVCREQIAYYQPNEHLCRFLERVYPNAYAEQQTLQRNSWQVDFLTPSWKSQLYYMLEKLDAHPPISRANTEKFLENTNIYTVICGPSTDTNVFTIMHNKEYEHPVVAILRKNGRVVILLTLEREFNLGLFVRSEQRP